MKHPRPYSIITVALAVLANFIFFSPSPAQPQDELELVIDLAQPTTPLPKIFKPNIDLSGRGFHRDPAWPQELAASEPLKQWQNDIKFSGLYRIQLNLWDISQFSRNPFLQKRLMDNYESVIRAISQDGATVVLNIFGTPAGMGKILDKKSAPVELREFKALIKDTMRYFSCEKKYNVWYEVWTAPDLDDFFLGRKQDYLAMYRVIGEAVKELEKETKVSIPLGGPGASWWFQSFEGNNTLNPEDSFLYEFVKFCHRYRLPLDFLSWHSYSSSVAVDKEDTIYRKTAVKLIRDWLSYFGFSGKTQMVISEWNYDRSANLLPERKEKASIAASYIPARIKSMYEAGIDNQIYYCLEDFQANKEGVVRNVGIFSFDPEYTDYRGWPKSIYNVFKMLSLLEGKLIPVKLDNDFVGVIATRDTDKYALIVFNYIDPDIVMNYLSRGIATLAGSERRMLLRLIKSDNLEKLLLKQLDVNRLHATLRVKNLLRKAIELNDKAAHWAANSRMLKLGLGGIKEKYSWVRYGLDLSCSAGCKFQPLEEKEIDFSQPFKEPLELKPYSVQLIILKKKPKTEEPVVEQVAAAPEKKDETVAEKKAEPAVEKKPEPAEENKAEPSKSVTAVKEPEPDLASKDKVQEAPKEEKAKNGADQKK